MRRILDRVRQARPLTAASAAVFIGVMPVVVSAQDFGDPDERMQQLEPVPQLSENLSGTVRPRSNERLSRIDTLADIFRAVGGCWQLPEGEAPSGQEITLRLAFTRKGEVLGQPRITYYRPGPGGAEKREAFSQSVREAFARCRPLPFTEKLGAAVAGRVFIFRFSDTAPM
jgi:hypothetical protein